MNDSLVAGSFRDPAAFVFVHHGEVHRQITAAGREDYELLMRSGLYEALTERGLLVPHEDLGRPAWAAMGAVRVIRPRQCRMIAFPYEYCFSQLQDAALVTLAAEREAIEKGMSLKDASAYNVQFIDGRATLIDTLSFERDAPGPWKAYRQFCRHFYAPLALTAYVDSALGRTSQAFIDGIPLRAASRALPWRTRFLPGPLMHLHLHAAAEDRLAGRRGSPRAAARDIKLPVVSSLQTAIRRLRWRPRSDWTPYYERRASYSNEAFEKKRAIVGDWLEAVAPSLVWDLGANTGHFARLASERGIPTVAFDRDAACVEQLYLDARRRNDPCLLPLVLDLANPSPAIGWANEERASLTQRGPADLALALALLHHLAFGNNVPLDRIARFLAGIARHLFIEFVPRTDPMARALLEARPGMFADYSQHAFEEAFGREFRLERRAELTGSERVLYWMRRT